MNWTRVPRDYVNRWHAWLIRRGIGVIGARKQLENWTKGCRACGGR